ncbi:MAG: hypothetical protein ACI4F6_02540 [Acutalibacteraceae bacterium]
MKSFTLLKKLRSMKTKTQQKLVTASAVLTTIATGMTTAFAAPTNVGTTQTNAVVDIIVWLGIVAIGAAGGIPSVLKITEGQANEDTRGRNVGIAGLVVTGACAGAVYAIKAIFFS